MAATNTASLGSLFVVSRLYVGEGGAEITRLKIAVVNNALQVIHK